MNHLPYYGLIISFGIILSFLYLLFVVRYFRLPDSFRFLLGVLGVMPFVFFGARLWTLFDEHFWEQFSKGENSLIRFLFILGIEKNDVGYYSISIEGLSFHGGLIGGFLYLWVFFWWYSRQHLYSQLFCFDLFLPVILIMQIVGRWGNFFNKELLSETLLTDNYPNEYGWIPERLADYLRNPIKDLSFDNRLRHPLFLYESLAHFFLLFFIFFLWPYFMKKLSVSPLIQNPVWNQKLKKLEIEFQRSSPYQKKYWKLIWKKYRFRKFCWKEAVHNSQLSYQSAPPVTLAKTTLYCRKNLTKNNYVAAWKNAYRDYRFFNRWKNLLKILMRRNSWALTNYFNPYQLKIPRVGTRTALYLIGHAIIRMILQNFRFGEDQMSITIPFLIFLLILGIFLFVFWQFLAPARFRSLGWFYETRY